MTFHPIAVFVLAGITFYVGVAHLVIYARTRLQQRDLWFALTCVAMGLYDLAQAGIGYSGDFTSALRWQWLQFLTVCVVAPCFIAFLLAHTERAARWPAKTLYVAWGLTAVGVIVSLLRPGLRAAFVGPTAASSLEDSAGDAILAQIGPVAPVLAVLALVTVTVAVWITWDYLKRGPRERAGPLLAAMAIFYAGVVNDAAIALGLYHWFFVGEIAFTAMVLMMAHNLSMELLGAARAHEQRASLEARFHQAEKMESVGRMTGSVAHDLNNLLSPILGYSELVLSNVEPDDDNRNDLEQIRTAAYRAKDLAQQLLAFSRKRQFEAKPISLNRVVVESAQMLRRVVRDGIELKLHLRSRGGPVQADSGQLQQVLLNLVVNAVDATPAGGVITVETDTLQLERKHAAPCPQMPLGTYRRMTVSDNGEGMTAEVQARVFEPFFTTKAQGKGTGLGLSSAREIVARHAGFVSLQSTVGQGTTFSIYLPESQEQEVEGVGELQPVHGVVGQGTVLVVEDETAVLDLATAILNRHGYEVLQARSGRSAIELAGQHDGTIHLLLTDVSTPDVTGPNTFHRLLASRPEMRILFMAGDRDSDAIRLDPSDPRGGVVVKPFSVKALTEKVREVLA